MGLERYDTRERAHEGVDVPLVINGETAVGEDGQPITFRIRGVAHPDVRRLLMQATPSRTPEEADQKDIALMRAAVIGWSDNLDLDGERLAFTRSNLDRVFAIPLVRRAIVAEIVRDQNFTKGG